MAAYEYEPLSHGGVSIQSAQYQSWYQIDNGPLRTREIGAVEANIIGRGQSAVRGQPQGLTFELHVALADLNQSSLDAFYAIFDEENGVVYHRMTDGAAVVWRMAVRQLAVRAVNANHFVIVLRAATGIWEADAATTVSHLNIAADSQAISPTNAGNRKARPVITITPDLVKTDDIEDYKWSLRCFFVNRAPKAWNNLPVWLFDQSAGAARIATNSSATGATVKQTTGATTTAEILDAVEPNIDITSAASWPASGMYYITDGANDEMGYYTSIAGNTLNGCVRGIGGKPAFAHASGVVIQPAGILANGDDLRVWVDDVEVERWLVAWNTAASDVVCNLTAPPVLKKTLAAAITAASTSVDFVEGALDLPVPGFLAFENEIVYYTTKTALGIQGMVRGVHSTTAAIHAISTLAYGNPQLITVAAGKAQAGSPPSPTSRRPAVQLVASNNANMKWGDQTDDASTVYYDPANPGRTAQWVPGFDPDGNAIFPLLQLSASSTILTFKDDVPGDGSPPYNYVEQSFPMSVRSGTSAAIINDWTPSVEVLNLEMFVRDASGTLKLVDQLQQSAAAPARALTGSLSGSGNYGVKLKARYNVITGWRGEDTSLAAITNVAGGPPVAGCVAVRFTFSGDRYPTKITCRMAKTAAGTQDIACHIYPDASNLPDSAAGSIANLPVVNINGTTPALYAWAIGPRALTKPGTYWAIFHQVTTTTSVNVYGTTNSRNDRISFAREAGAAWVASDRFPTQEPWFYVTGIYDPSGDAFIEPDQPVVDATTAARTGITASFDKTSILWQLVHIPYVHRTGAFTNGLVHENGVMASATTGEGFALDKWMLAGAALEIDCNLRTAVYTENGVPFPAKANVAPVNPAEWLTLDPGVNSLTFTEPHMRQHDVVTVFRAVKV